jgi:hypothetical protein
MSVPAVPASMPGASDQASPNGRNLATWSLLMLPMLLVSVVLATYFGMYMLGGRDLEGSEPMSVQGAYGWMVWAVSTAILLAPTMIGVVLGFRALRRGGKGLALAGLLINAAILVGYTGLGLVNLLGQ